MTAAGDGSVRRRLAAVLAGLALTLTCAPGCGRSAPATAPLDYAAVDATTAVPVSLANLRGAPVLLAGWATWCPPCERELPELERLHREQDAGDGPEGDGLQVVVVNVDDVADDVVAAAITEHGLTTPVWRDRRNRFGDVVGGVAFPVNALVDADGRLVRTWNGVLDVDDDEFRELVRASW